MEVHHLIALALSSLIGLSLGLLGGGGSILAVPVLVYVARVDVPAAVGMSLAIVGSTALVGGVVHARAHRVDLRAAALFGVSGMLSAPIGAQATHLVSPRILLLLFAALMKIVAAAMIFSQRNGDDPAIAPPPAHLPLAMATGAGVGVLTGFLGVGGGFLIVPALTLLAALPIHRAVGTSLLVIAANSATGLLAHLHQGSIPLRLTVALTLAAMAGALVGVRISSRLEPQRLRRAFAAFVFTVGLALAFRNAFGL